MKSMKLFLIFLVAAIWVTILVLMGQKLFALHKKKIGSHKRLTWLTKKT